MSSLEKAKNDKLDARSLKLLVDLECCYKRMLALSYVPGAIL